MRIPKIISSISDEEKTPTVVRLLEFIQRQSEKIDCLEDEIKILILHGTLHLLGWDHETDQGEMQAEEQRLRRKLGLPTGLIERAQAC